MIKENAPFKVICIKHPILLSDSKEISVSSFNNTLYFLESISETLTASIQFIRNKPNRDDNLDGNYISYKDSSTYPGISSFRSDFLNQSGILF